MLQQDDKKEQKLFTLMFYKESNLCLSKSHAKQPHTQPALTSEKIGLEIQPEARIWGSQSPHLWGCSSNIT